MKGMLSRASCFSRELLVYFFTLSTFKEFSLSFRLSLRRSSLKYLKQIGLMTKVTRYLILISLPYLNGTYSSPSSSKLSWGKSRPWCRMRTISLTDDHPDEELSAG